MKRKPTRSPVYQLLMLIWDTTPRPPKGSWECLNVSMRDAMRLAIEAGFPFDLDDFTNAIDNFRGYRWFGGSEGFYSNAIKAGNLSAAQAFEKWKSREPFIVDNVDRRKRYRLAVGSCFSWRGEQVTVTSFAEDSTYLTACSYHPGDNYPRKVDRRCKITVAGIHEERQTKRERTRLYDRVAKLTGDTASRAVNRLKRLGITTEADWHKAPIAKLREITQEFEA